MEKQRLLAVCLVVGFCGFVSAAEIHRAGSPQDVVDRNTGADPADRRVLQQLKVAGPAIIVAIKADTLVIDADGDGVASPGDTLRYEISVANTGSSLATGVELADNIPAHTSVVAGSVTTTKGTVVTEDPVEVALGELAAGESATVSFDVVIVNPLASGASKVVNQGTVTSDQLPAVLTDDPEVGGDQDDTVTAVFAAPNITAEKTDELSVDADFDGQVSPGDTLLYTIEVGNQGNTAATGVVFVDAIPENTSLVPGSVASSMGTVDSEDPLQVTVGQLDASAAATISFRVDIDNPLSLGVTEVANQGTVSSDQLPAVPTDDPDASGDEDPTITGLSGSIGWIGGTVWCDSNLNGSYGLGEGVSGVTIDLSTDAACDGNPDGLLAAQDTVGQGQYLFSDLDVGPLGGPGVCYVVEADVADMGVCDQPIQAISFAVLLDSSAPDELDIDFGFWPPMDFGDLPGMYSLTTLADNGARHSIDSLAIGTCVDAEPDGIPHATAEGDDLLDTGCQNDEAAIVPGGNWVAGNGHLDFPATFTGDGCLNIWLDFTDGALAGGDGDFDDSLSSISEHVVENLPVGAATASVDFSLPPGAISVVQTLYMRSRFTPRDSGGACGAEEAYVSPGGAAPTGAAIGGCVIDIQVPGIDVPVGLVSFSVD